MNFFDKLEQFIVILGGLIAKAVLFLIPTKIINFIGTSFTSVKNFIKKIANKIMIFLTGVLSKIISIPKAILSRVQLIVPILMSLVEKLKSIRPSNFLPKRWLIPLIALLSPLFTKIYIWLTGLSPKAIVLSVTLSAIVGLASISIYSNSKKIYKDSSPKSEEVKVSPSNMRADYRKGDEKELFINDVQMPVYIEGAGTAKALIFDFSIRLSNRYLKVYFEEKEYLIKDKLNATLLPVVPTFPLEKEGKVIIKDKVKKELNKLIKEQKIEGEVKDVFFLGIITA